ncbi:MAG TPA: hypothetical protein VJ809_09085 [Pirellulales bacterium]|nr:hypothetical protein [Pirellulales bacterium]
MLTYVVSTYIKLTYSSIMGQEKNKQPYRTASREKLFKIPPPD